MPLQLIIGNKTYSSWSLRPWLLLRQFEVAFEEVRIPLWSAEWQARIARYSPSGKVPALLHDGLQVWDSLAIAEYANEQLLDGRGWPAALSLRTLARCMAAEMHSGFASLRSEMPMNLRRSGRPPARCSAATEADIARIRQLWSEALALSGGPFLCGGFGIVDAFYAPVASRFRSYGVALDGASAEYAARLLDLPAFRQWEAEALAEAEELPQYATLP